MINWQYKDEAEECMVVYVHGAPWRETDEKTM